MLHLWRPHLNLGSTGSDRLCQSIHKPSDLGGLRSLTNRAAHFLRGRPPDQEYPGWECSNRMLSAPELTTAPTCPRVPMVLVLLYR